MLDSIHEDRPFYLSMPTVGWRLAKALSRIFDPINVKSILPKSSTYNSLVESTKEQLKHVNEVNFNGHNIILNVITKRDVLNNEMEFCNFLVEWFSFSKRTDCR